MILDDLKTFSKNIKGNIIFEHEIRKLNWFNIGGKVKVFFKPDSLHELIQFLKLYKNRGKIFLLGAGSNVLFSDDLYEGVVIKLGKRFCNISALNEKTIIAGSGVLDKKISEFTKDYDIGGFEFLSCIPGTIGGGIKMNSGCYDREFKNIILSVQALDYDGNIITIPSDKIKFLYRNTNLPNNLIFLSATLQGYKSDNKSIEQRIINLKKEKEKTQPSRIKTGGSTFKNPINKNNLKVWELIKNSVSLNKHFGDAKISAHHSNFFINEKNAKFEDMMKLIKYVKKEVKKKYEIDLELEVVVVD